MTDFSLGIIGSGNVGKALGNALLTKGYEVLFHDISEEQLMPLREARRETTLNIEDLSDCFILFICVPTEDDGTGACDTSILESVVKNLSHHRGIIVQVSTCPPGTARKMSKLTHSAYVIHPSFYSMRGMSYDALHPVKVLLGSRNGIPIASITDIFRHFDGPIYWSTWEGAELAKYADNALSATLISYWNEIFILAQTLGVDSEWICRTVDADPLYRSVFRFFGKAFGGFCLPKDLSALRSWAQGEVGLKTPLLDAVQHVNEEMARRFGIEERHLAYRAIEKGIMPRPRKLKASVEVS